MFRVIVLAWAAGLTACASPPYRAPAEGPTAKIKFSTAGTSIGATIHADANCADPQRVTENGVFFDIAAERKIAITRGFSSEAYPPPGAVGVSASCGATFAFTPRQGKLYEMTYRHGIPHCFFLLTELGDDGRPIVLAERTAHPVYGQLGNWPRFMRLEYLQCKKAG